MHVCEACALLRMCKMYQQRGLAAVTCSHPCALKSTPSRSCCACCVCHARCAATEICSALSYLHARSILHGGLTPSNVLLTAYQKDARGWIVQVCADCAWDCAATLALSLHAVCLR